MSDLVGREVRRARWAGPLNLRFLGMGFLALLGLLGAEWAAATWRPTGAFQPHPVLGHVRRPGPEALSIWGGGREAPWPAPGQGVRILVLGSPRWSRPLTQDASPTVARIVGQHLQGLRPDLQVTVGASMQENYDVAQTLLLADRLVPQLRPDVLALTLFRMNLAYRPAPPPGLSDRVQERLMATHLVGAALLTLWPNQRTGDLSELPSDLLLANPHPGLEARGDPENRALAALESMTRVVLFPCRESLGSPDPTLTRKLFTAGRPAFWLDEAGPLQTDEDLARGLAAGLEAALP